MNLHWVEYDGRQQNGIIEDQFFQHIQNIVILLNIFR